MNNSNDNLVLHLKLDAILKEGETKKLIDVSSQRNNGTIEGNPKIVADETFGSCLSFDGSSDYIEINDTDAIDFDTHQDFTVESWVKIASSQTFNNNDDNDIIEKWSGSDGYAYVIRYQRSVQAILAARYDGYNNPSILTKTKLKNEQFYHIAFVKKEGKLFLYLDGQEEGSADDTTQAPTKNNSPLYLARRGGNDFYSNFFTGIIANLRIYNKALSLEEIKRDINDDHTVSASFNQTYPFDFNLYEGENKEPVIFIENGTKGQELTLEIVNNSGQSIDLPQKSDEVAATNYHFELRFRPDTLSPSSLQELVLLESKDWRMSRPVTQADGMVSLYFLQTNNQSLNANETVSLNLQHINGAAAGGARKTRVELLFPQFICQKETFNYYYREKSLSIINHRGKKNIPLHVGFLGSNRVLNDGTTQNTLILRITNVLKDKPIPFNSDSEGNEASKLIIYFDIDHDWALGTASQVKAIEITAKDWGSNEEAEEDWTISKRKEGELPIWTITHQNKEAGLAPGQVVQLTISNIISSPSFGNTNLYLRYENIPGYWDGTFICTVEKLPIVYDNNGNVGIGTNKPVSNLEIRKNASQALGPILTLHNSDGGLGAGAAIDFNSYDVYENPPCARIQSIDDNYSNHIVFHTKQPGNIGNPLSERLRISNDGNVGIGTTDPGTNKLKVQGDTAIVGTITANALQIGKTVLTESELNILKVLVLLHNNDRSPTF